MTGKHSVGQISWNCENEPRARKDRNEMYQGYCGGLQKRGRRQGGEVGDVRERVDRSYC